jgi:hypothetical protein
MKKLILMAVVIGLSFCGIGLAATFNDYNERDFLKCDGGEFLGAQAVTATNTTLTFTKDTKALFIYNRGANEVYVDPRDGVAVASDANGGIRIEAGESRDLSAFQTRSVGIICSTTETSTVQVDVCY